jgi:hypothetical protein
MTWGKVRATLKKEHPQTASAAKKLYEHTITYGAHPNVFAQLSSSSDDADGQTLTHSHEYFVLPGRGECGDWAFPLCLKTVAQVGVCSLCIFQRIYPDRFRLAGIDLCLKELKVGL